MRYLIDVIEIILFLCNCVIFKSCVDLLNRINDLLIRQEVYIETVLKSKDENNGKEK